MSEPGFQAGGMTDMKPGSSVFVSANKQTAQIRFMTNHNHNQPVTSTFLRVTTEGGLPLASV